MLAVGLILLVLLKVSVVPGNLKYKMVLICWVRICSHLSLTPNQSLSRSAHPLNSSSIQCVLGKQPHINPTTCFSGNIAAFHWDTGSSCFGASTHTSSSQCNLTRKPSLQVRLRGEVALNKARPNLVGQLTLLSPSRNWCASAKHGGMRGVCHPHPNHSKSPMGLSQLPHWAGFHLLLVGIQRNTELSS